MDWMQFKARTEAQWVEVDVEPHVFGFQIVSGTRWNAGMSEPDIQLFEQRLGFPLPLDYQEMVRCINGFDRECINVHGSHEDAKPSYSRQFYKYPDDLLHVQGWLDQIAEFRSFVDDVLEAEGFDVRDLIGFVPLYGHRALAVFRDRTLSPVISIVGNDVIIYGLNLAEYVQHEFFSNEFMNR
ncbi:hypothetical protein [Variovorax sp. W6]|uniref:hypothetical protein n=1 Tax=Variovorax sp. W6 TaxID=3093895 RepID=UPI003D803335